VDIEVVRKSEGWQSKHYFFGDNEGMTEWLEKSSGGEPGESNPKLYVFSNTSLLLKLNQIHLPLKNHFYKK